MKIERIFEYLKKHHYLTLTIILIKQILLTCRCLLLLLLLSAYEMMFCGGWPMAMPPHESCSMLYVQFFP